MAAVREAGRRMLFWGALLLMAWAAYELSTRLDTLRLTTPTVMKMAADLHASLLDVLFKYGYINALKIPLFLLGCLVFGVIVLLFRNRPLAAYAFVPLCVLLVLISVDAKLFFSKSLWELLKLIPLAVIALGSLIGLSFHYLIKRRKKAAPADARPGGGRFLR